MIQVIKTEYKSDIPSKMCIVGRFETINQAQDALDRYAEINSECSDRAFRTSKNHLYITDKDYNVTKQYSVIK